MTGAEFRAWRIEKLGVNQHELADIFELEARTIKHLERLPRVPNVIEFATQGILSVTPIVAVDAA